MSSSARPDPTAHHENSDSQSTGASPSAALPPVAAEDQASLFLVAGRDLAILVVLLTLFGAGDTWARSSGLALAQLVAALDGLLVGAAAAAMLHEWGHFAGARLAGGHSPLKPLTSFPQVFDFDYAGNDTRSFVWMSVGGNVGNWTAALFFALALPLGTLGPDALVSGAVAFSVFTALVELPVVRKAREGMPGLDALRTIPKDFTTRYLPHAFAAGLLTFLIL